MPFYKYFYGYIHNNRKVKKNGLRYDQVNINRTNFSKIPIS